MTTVLWHGRTATLAQWSTTDVTDEQRVTSQEPIDQPLKLGLFDIMQIDPVLQQDSGAIYAQRLDDLGYADDQGFDVAFSAERHFMRRHVIPSATTWIASAAQRTTTMRLGMLGYTLPIRDPVQLAEEVAMVDQLSGGRLEVGLGLGHRVEELEALGIDPQQKVQLFQQRVAMIQALWSGGKVSFEGGGVTARDVAIWPLPAQEPHPPIWFAGTEPIAASWMASRGFGLAVGFKPTNDLTGTVAGWRAGLKAQSEQMRQAAPPRPVGSLALMRHVYLAEDNGRAMDEITDDLVKLNELANGGDSQGSRTDRRNSAREHADQLIATDVMVAGGPDKVAAQIQASRDVLGFDLLLANVYAAGVEQERVHRTIRLLSTDVRERLAAPVPANT
jgi:alkanesulfonate monooxygenase SsuD/methylene tetrahydromethanopterin reductase-like flavin-dependent oxidoreductase (luciferase family)